MTEERRVRTQVSQVDILSPILTIQHPLHLLLDPFLHHQQQTKENAKDVAHMYLFPVPSVLQRRIAGKGMFEGC